MRNRLLIGVVLCAAAWLGFHRPAKAQGQAPVGQYIVVLHDAVPNIAAVANEHAQQHAANVPIRVCRGDEGIRCLNSRRTAECYPSGSSRRLHLRRSAGCNVRGFDTNRRGSHRCQLGYAMEINPAILNGLEVAVIDTEAVRTRI